MFAPGEDRTHDLQIALLCDYETDALPTALPRLDVANFEVPTGEFKVIINALSIF